MLADSGCTEHHRSLAMPTVSPCQDRVKKMAVKPEDLPALDDSAYESVPQGQARSSSGFRVAVTSSLPLGRICAYFWAGAEEHHFSSFVSAYCSSHESTVYNPNPTPQPPPTPTQPPPPPNPHPPTPTPQPPHPNPHPPTPTPLADARECFSQMVIAG